MAERFENREAEKTPDEMVNDAVLAKENEAEADSVEGSWWSKTAKEFFSPSGNAKDIAFGGAVLGIVGYRVLRGVLTFAGEAIKKKGQVGFGGGYQIGKDMFDFSDKKDKRQK